MQVLTNQDTKLLKKERDVNVMSFNVIVIYQKLHSLGKASGQYVNILTLKKYWYENLHVVFAYYQQVFEKRRYFYKRNS